MSQLAAILADLLPLDKLAMANGLMMFLLGLIGFSVFPIAGRLI